MNIKAATTARHLQLPFSALLSLQRNAAQRRTIITTIAPASSDSALMRGTVHKALLLSRNGAFF